MAYDDIKKDFGRRPVWIVELFLQQCLLTYSIAPCEAVLGVTGDTKCYNTLNTCQDVENFDPSTANPLRFSSQRVDEIQTAGDAPTFPTLLSVDTTPTKLEPGKGLGIRSSLKVTLMDHPWTDVGIDPYLGEATRPVQDPDSEGSFWGKLLARNKFWEGRRIDILTGYLDSEDGTYDAANFLRRTYVVEAIAGPDRRGNVSIVAKDPLKFADSNRSEVPELTSALLDSDVDDSTTTIPVGTGEGAQFSVDDFIRIDEEIMQVTVVTVDDLTVDRETLPSFYPPTGTRAAEHDSGATVQICKFYDNERADDIISELLITESGIDPTFIDLAAWATTFDNEIPSYLFSALVTEPTGVKDLLQELTEHTILLWWDDRAQLIEFDVLRPAAFGVIPLYDDDENILADSFVSSRISKERVSRVFVYYGQRDPTEDLTRKNNFQQVVGRTDLDSETPEEYGSSRTLNGIPLTEHTILLWWDDRAQLIEFDVLRPAAFGVIPLYDDDENILADSFVSSRISKERVSRVFVYYGQRDPTEDLTRKNNFQQVVGRTDLDSETPEEYGSSRTLNIFSRWLPVAKAAVADEIGQRLLVEYRDTKINATFVIDPKDDTEWTGAFIKLKTRYVQDENGLPEERQYRIIAVSELLTKTGARYKYLATQSQLEGRIGVWSPDEDPPATPYPEYPAASDEQRIRAFWADDDGLMSNGDEGYVWS